MLILHPQTSPSMRPELIEIFDEHDEEEAINTTPQKLCV